jgi:hypothetical protein
MAANILFLTFCFQGLSDKHSGNKNHAYVDRCPFHTLSFNAANLKVLAKKLCCEVYLLMIGILNDIIAPLPSGFFLSPYLATMSFYNTF